MALSFRPTGAPVGAFVSGFDPDNFSRGEAGEIYRAFLEYGVLVFKGMKLDVAAHVRIAGLLGELKDPHEIEEFRLKEDPRLTLLAANGGQPVAQDDPEADKIIGVIPWHADHMYTPRPYRGTLLRAVVIPEKGGNTGWIDTVQIYRSLPYRVKCKIQALRIVHSLEHALRSQSMFKTGAADRFPPVSHPLVLVHPETNLPALNIGPSSAMKIIGLPEAEAAELFEYLVTFATRDENAYVHEWEPGDLVAWDNLRAIHRAYGHPKRYPRVMHSAGLKAEMVLGQYLTDDPLATASAA